MRRVAITGVAGYIGSQLAARLDKHPGVEAIIGVDVHAPEIDTKRLRFFPRDISLPLDGLFAKEKVDAVVHLAFVVSPVHDEKKAREADVLGAHNVIRESRLAGVQHIIYLSSTSAYGAHRDNPEMLTEDSPLRPNKRFQYSRDKAESDLMFQSLARGQPDTAVTILRSCIVMGPHGGNAVVARMFRPVMTRLLRRNPQMQFVHEDDLVNILVACLEKRPAGVFNVAGDGTLPYQDVARLARRRMVTVPRGILAPLMNATWALRLQNDSPPAGLDFIAYPWVADNSKLKQELGFQYAYTSADTLRDFAQEREVKTLGTK